MTTKEIVLVTGSSGCLGQFVVKLLQENDDHVGEIRLFDKISYANKLGHSVGKKMTKFVADIRNSEALVEAIDGVDCVIHAAAAIDLRPNPDAITMETVNVDGTRAVIEACLKSNVPRLVYASTTDILFGGKPIYYGTEISTPVPTSFVIGKYSETKCKGEELVLKANGRLCSDGKTVLRTLALRPMAFYGENDKYFITPFLKLAREWSGDVHYRVKRSDERFQGTYVGNSAWAFLKAKDRLVDETVSGEDFFVTDDTPITDVHELARPYLEARGFHISPFVIPYWIAWIILSVIKMADALKLVDLKVPSVDVLNFICTTCFFNRSKAALRLGYQPIYTPEEARRRSMQYYKEVTI